MIHNQRQYRVTKGQIAKLAAALDSAHRTGARMAPPVYAAMVAGIESQIQELQAQLDEYDELREAAEVRLDSVRELPPALIKARIAGGYTQAELANRLGWKPQQVQRYEATAYRSASLKRILDVLEALAADFHAVIHLRSDHDRDPGRPSE